MSLEISEVIDFMTPEDIQGLSSRLVLLHHAMSCEFSNAVIPKKCRISPLQCYSLNLLLQHIKVCNDVSCALPECAETKTLLNHNAQCLSNDCLVCKPLRESQLRKMMSAQRIVKKRRMNDDMYTPRSEISDCESVYSARNSDIQLSITSSQCTPVPAVVHGLNDSFNNDMDEFLNMFDNNFDNIFENEPESARSAASFANCKKCNFVISIGFRYYCEACDCNFCSDCYHDDSNGAPHNHPVKAHKVTGKETHSKPKAVTFEQSAINANEKRSECGGVVCAPCEFPANFAPIKSPRHPKVPLLNLQLLQQAN